MGITLDKDGSEATLHFRCGEKGCLTRFAVRYKEDELVSINDIPVKELKQHAQEVIDSSW